MVGEPAEYSYRYLYERLGEKQFQNLCAALLAHKYPDVTCYPVGQSDGGRDIVLDNGADAWIFQVKWAKTTVRNPVTWLKDAIAEEATNIVRLVDEGASRYVLVTSVAGTAMPGRGNMDRLKEATNAFAARFGIPVDVWWRADVDARLDAAPADLKLAYPDMLAGVATMTVAQAAAQAEETEKRLRTLLSTVMATQWEDDAKVKFKQAELNTAALADLFVDVHAVAVDIDDGSLFEVEDDGAVTQLGGAAAYLLRTSIPCTLVRGNPGQGKSTLGQYLCQVYRSLHLPGRRSGLPSDRRMVPEARRFAIRADLRDYASWLGGGLPFGRTSAVLDHFLKPRQVVSVEAFLAELIRFASGGRQVGVEDVADALRTLPMLVVLDGLDEIAQPARRAQVVEEINGFAARMAAGPRPQLIVTTRPNASGLPEPSGTGFQTIVLQPLQNQLRNEYLHKWAQAHHIHGKQRRELEQVFAQRSGEPHVMELASNPMQLAILLYLMDKRGVAVPTARTELYRSYMETFLDREASKSAAVEDHRHQLEEITAYLGWHVQAGAETNGTNGRVPTRELRAAIFSYLDAVQQDTDMVGALFTAVTDRVWALTSKVEGTFEFDVQPMREYFAASYLSEYAGERDRHFDTSVIMRELARRGYWHNTCRFYAGFAKPAELPGIEEDLGAVIAEGAQPWQSRLTAWTLLADGIFTRRELTQRKVVAHLGDDLGLRLIAHVLADDQTSLPELALDHGGAALAAVVEQRWAGDPDGPLAPEYRDILNALNPGRVYSWWGEHYATAPATRKDCWLRLGLNLHRGHYPNQELEKYLTSTPGGPSLAINSGMRSVSGSGFEHEMIDAVLAGSCSDAEARIQDVPYDLLVLLAPRNHLKRAVAGRAAVDRLAAGHASPATERDRRAALDRLRFWFRLEPMWEWLQVGAGKPTTTAYWTGTADIVETAFEPCWLAFETAIMGAALPAAAFPTDDSGFSRSGYAVLLRDLRAHTDDAGWWESHLLGFGDPLNQGAAALAFAVLASDRVVNSLAAQFSQSVASLSRDLRHALIASSSRLGASQMMGRRISDKVFHRTAKEGMLPEARLILAHHLAYPRAPRDLDSFSTYELHLLGEHGIYAWPALRTLTARVADRFDGEVLRAAEAYCGVPTGPAPVFTAAWGPDLAETILANAARLPLKWVVAAEQHIARLRSNDIPLESVARAGEWFAV
jgi:hypothetical protein